MAKTSAAQVQSVKRPRDFSDLIYTGPFFVMAVAYLILVFLVAPNPATLHHYHLSATRYHWLILPIILFLLLIWSAGLYGSMKVKSYANLIGNSRDGRAFNLLAIGFLILALSAPFTSLFRSLSVIVTNNHPGALPALTITDNYLNLVTMCAALWFIAAGAGKLSKMAGARLRAGSKDVWVFWFIVFSSLYGYFLVGQPVDDGANAFHLPQWLVLVTLAIPYIFFWYKGLRGAMEIYQYQRNVRGRLYKSSLRYLAAGITLVVASSVITRTLSTIPTQVNQLKLTPILLIIYALLIIMAAGYLTIALGAKKLRQIEET